MAGPGSLVPDPAAFGAAAEREAEQDETNDGSKALWHPPSLADHGGGGECCVARSSMPR